MNAPQFRPPFGVRSAAALVLGWLLALGGLGALLSCGSPGDPGPVDPVCGSISADLSGESIRVDKRSDAPRLWERLEPRHHVLGERPRYAVTGFRRLRIAPVEESADPETGARVQSIRSNRAMRGAAAVRFSRETRARGEDRWVEQGWVDVPRVGDDRGGHHPVRFDEVGPTDRLSRQARVNAYASPTGQRHAYETDAFVLPEGAVLDVGIGVLPGGAGEGSIAWRLLACAGERCACVHAEVMDAGVAAERGWQQRRLDLRLFAGERRLLRFETEALRSDSGVVDPGLWVEPEIRSVSARAETEPPNLLIISLDTLGAEHLGLYGYPRDTSPYIDRELAPAGTVFMRAIAPATTTGPSHMTLFTSLPPSAHGVVSNLGGKPLPSGIPTLAEVLGSAGYVTGGVTENGAITLRLGFGRGFDHYEENRSARMIRPEGHIAETFAAGRRFLDRTAGLPWFLFLQTYQVHHPYVPPPEYASLFVDDGLAKEAEEFAEPGFRDFRPLLYDQEIRFTDEQLRRFLQALEGDGLLDNTIVVVLSDHGEEFFEHRYLGHGADLHTETVHVPLIFKGPGIAAGGRIDERAGLADVMPTVLDLMGVAPPDGLVGRSFAEPLRDGGRSKSGPARPIFSEAWQNIGITRTGRVEPNQPTLAVERGQYKLIRYRDGEDFRFAFYDLAVDPGETANLVADGAPPEGEAAAAYEALVGLLTEYEAEALRRAAASGAQPEADPSGEIDPERLEKLRALGYVE